MTRPDRSLQSSLRWLQSKILPLLLGSYLLAALLPGPGLWLRACSLGTLPLPGGGLPLSLPTLLLALLLGNAALAVDTRQLRLLGSRPGALILGLVANTVVPLLFTFLLSGLAWIWHDLDEVQSILVGLALIGAMPIAAASTAWAGQAAGNPALSLGLVLSSTLLSPLTTPWVFAAVARVTSGDLAEDLLTLAGGDTQRFLLAAVVLPSLLGLGLRVWLGPQRLQPYLPWLQLSSLTALLLINHLNAATALPQMWTQPDWDLLALTLACALLVCSGAFAAGAGLGRLLRADRPERISLTFGLGMNNNGSGLVLAATALGDHPQVLFTIVVYNLLQQLIAAWLQGRLRPGGPPAAPPPGTRPS